MQAGPFRIRPAEILFRPLRVNLAAKPARFVQPGVLLFRRIQGHLPGSPDVVQRRFGNFKRGSRVPVFPGSLLQQRIRGKPVQGELIGVARLEGRVPVFPRRRPRLIVDDFDIDFAIFAIFETTMLSRSPFIRLSTKDLSSFRTSAGNSLSRFSEE